MINTNEKSNAQSWELEITCKNKQYLKAVVKAMLKYGHINFEVENVEYHPGEKDWDGRYLILMWSSWFHNLADISKDLSKIEKKLENF